MKFWLAIGCGKMQFSNHFQGINEDYRLHLKPFISLGYFILSTQCALEEASFIGLVVHPYDLLAKREIMVYDVIFQ